MGMLLHKDHDEQYWRGRNGVLIFTPGFAEVFTRDNFLAVWSILHCVNEEDPNRDNSDKIYKTRLIFDFVLERFHNYYVPDSEFQLDKKIIPTKKLPFHKAIYKTYQIRDKNLSFV